MTKYTILILLLAFTFGMTVFILTDKYKSLNTYSYSVILLAQGENGSSTIRHSIGDIKKIETYGQFIELENLLKIHYPEYSEIFIQSFIEFES